MKAKREAISAHLESADEPEQRETTTTDILATEEDEDVIF